MANFTKCNIVSGFYSSTDNIKNFKFKVKLIEISKGIPILKSSLLDTNLQTENTSFSEEKLFSWQEKSVSSKKATETNSNETSSIEENKSVSSSYREKLFSYVDEDNYTINELVLANRNSDMKIISKTISDISLTHPLAEKKFLSIWKANNNMEESIKTEKHIEKMYILADMNNHSKDPALILKREHLLFIITYNRNSKELIVSPDFNDIEVNPYIIEISYGAKQLFHYSIQQIISDIDEKKSTEIFALTKLHQHNNTIRLRKKHLTFWVPPRKTSKCIVIFEIKSAHSFEYDNLFVEYSVELPYGYKSVSSLNGKTQISRVKGVNKVANFGHIFELNIDCDIQCGNDRDYSLTMPKVYFEIVSSDYWGRKRTEGYCYVCITVTKSGYRNIILHSSRPVGDNKRLWDMKRYFIGGRHILKDIASTYKTLTFQGDCIIKPDVTYENSGSLRIGMNIVNQNRSYKDGSTIKEVTDENTSNGAIGTESLFKSVYNAIEAYKRAEEKLKSENIWIDQYFVFHFDSFYPQNKI